MKKIILIGMVLVFFTMSGCSYYFEGVDSLKNASIDEQYWFDDYESFTIAKDNIKANSDIFYIDKYEEVKTSKVENIEASVVFEDIKIIREKRSDVKIQYIGIFDLTSNAKEPEYTIEGGKSFVFKVNWEKLTGKSRGMMLIYLPNDYDGDLKVSSVSGDIAAGDLNVQDVKLNAVSGDINFGEIKAEKITIKTVSGDVNGNVSDGSYIYIESASGEVELKVYEQEGDIKIKTVSGEVALEIKGKMNTRLDIHSNSGTVSCDYDINSLDKKTENILVAKISSGKYLIEIDTVSGSITLR